MTLNVRNISQEQISYSLGEPNDEDTKNTVIGLLKRIHSSSSGSAETIDQLIDDVDDLQETKADKSTTYTKTEVDNALALKANQSTTYTKTEVDNNLALKANKSETYTKTQVDNALTLKANSSDVYTKTQVYTKTEVDNDLALKADKSDTYTKTQVDNLISGGTITNYVTTDTLQTITGTKMFNEIHANKSYAAELYVNTHKFSNVAAVSGDSSSGDNTLCTKTYIDNSISNCYPNTAFTVSNNFKAGVSNCIINTTCYYNNSYHTHLFTMPIFYFMKINSDSSYDDVYISGSFNLNINSLQGQVFITSFSFDSLECIPINHVLAYQSGGIIDGEYWYSASANNFPLWHNCTLLRNTQVTGGKLFWDGNQDVLNFDGRWTFYFKNYHIYRLSS